MLFWKSGRRAAAITLLIAAAGCSRAPSQSADSRQRANQSHEQAEAAFQSGDLATAGEHFAAAIQHGLSADNYANAVVKQTVCWAAAGKYEEAMAELDKLEAGAPNLDQVYAARSYVLAKQGKLAESREALAKAKQFNRALQEFKD